MEENLTRLYWKTDKERINTIIQHLNPKYLKGLYKRFDTYNEEGYAMYLGDGKAPFYNTITVKYDGCIFEASRKTLRKELVRRGFIKQEKWGSTYSDGRPMVYGYRKF